MSKKLLSKILAFTLVVTMVLTMGITSVFAEYDQIEKEVGGVVYSEDFSDQTIFPTTDTFTIKNGTDWVDEKQVGNSDWYLTKGSGDPFNGPLGVSIVHNSEAKEGRQNAMVLTGEAVSLDQFYYRRGTVIYKGDLSKLTNTYQITYKLNKSALAENSFKFGGANSANCYRFAMTGVNDQSTSGNPVWVLDRIVGDSNAERLLQSDTTYKKSTGTYTTVEDKKVFSEYGAMHELTTVKITVVDNSSITVDVDGQVFDMQKLKETKKVDLSSPITVDGKNSIFGFGAGYNTTDEIYSFEIANYVEVGEADNGIYANVAKTADANGVIELDEAVTISSIVNNGAESTTVLLSKDGDTYKKLADVDGQTKYVNDLTGDKFKYVKLMGSKDVSIYTPLTALKVAGAAYPLKARIDGEDVEDAVFTSSNKKIATFVGNTIVPFRSGNVTITVNDTLNYNVRVNAAFSKSTDFTAISEFVDGEVSEVLNADNSEDGIQVDEDWSFEFMDEDKYYAATFHSWPKIEASTSGLKIYNHPLARNITCAPMLTLKNLPAELGKNFKMKMNINKNSVACGLGIRFLVHNDGKNYYMLHLSGNTESDGYIYVFEKYADNEMVGSYEGPEYDSDMSYDGRFGTGVIPMEITYENGTISWSFKATRQGGKEATYSGQYIDELPFDVNVEDTTLGFVQNAPGIDESGIGNRYSIISSFSIDSIDGDISTFCKDGVCGLSVDPDFYNYGIKAYIAEYDAEGRLAGIASGTEAVGYKMKATDNKVKAFVFDSHNTLKPIPNISKIDLK